MGYINHNGIIFYIKDASETEVKYAVLKYNGWVNNTEEIFTLPIQKSKLPAIDTTALICGDINKRYNDATNTTGCVEYLESAAILFCDKEDNPGVTFGLHHSDCILGFSEMGLRARDRHDEIQGFWTTRDRFLTREQAYKLACRTKQMKDGYPCAMDIDHRLCSEYVNFKRREY